MDPKTCRLIRLRRQSGPPAGQRCYSWDPADFRAIPDPREAIPDPREAIPDPREAIPDPRELSSGSGRCTPEARVTRRLLDQHWTSKMEAIARHMIRQANGYAWMHDRMAYSSKKWENVLNIVSGALGSVIGTAGLVTVFIEDPSLLWVKLVGATIGYVVSVVSILKGTWRLSESQSSNTLAQVNYSLIRRELMHQLAQDRKDRRDAREFMKTKFNEIEQLKATSPIVDATTRSAYKRVASSQIFEPCDQWAAILTDAKNSQDSGSDEISASPHDPLGLINMLVSEYETSHPDENRASLESSSGFIAELASEYAPHPDTRPSSSDI